MKAVDILNRVVTRLETIRTSAGYHTDAGLRVYRTILGMPLPEDLILPAIMVRMDAATVEATNRINRVDARETMALIVEGAVAVTGQTEPDTALLHLLWDLRTALMADTTLPTLLHGIEPIQLGAASFRLPEGGNALAVVVQPITFLYTERYALT